MKIEILGGGSEIGRLAVHISVNGANILLDYGINFDENDIPQLPLHIEPKKVDILTLSHAHLDHIGAAPLLYISSNIKVYTTRVTRDLVKPMFEDFLQISGYHLPFEYYEVNKLIQNVETVRYGDIVDEGNIRLEFTSAGHIPGSMMTIIHSKRKSLVFTGDVNTIDTNLVKGASFSGVKAEYLILEATYANATHPPRNQVERRFIEAVKEVLENNGIVLIPAFALSRSQEILCILRKYNIEPVFYDGMVREINRILLSNLDFLNEKTLFEDAIVAYNEVRGWYVRKHILNNPCVIVASAGMLKGGPALYYLKRIYENERNAIFLVSFQAPNTPGYNILATGSWGEGGVRVRARVEWFDFSSHAGKHELMEIVKSIENLEKVIIVHSEYNPALKLAQNIMEELGIEVIIARNGMRVELED